MSTATVAAAASPWRPFATAAYFLAGLVVLAPAIAFGFAIWPLNPLSLSWRHVSSGMILDTTPMIWMAALGILLAARMRGDPKVLQILRWCGMIGLLLGVPFAVLYGFDSVTIYSDLPVQHAQSFVGIEMRMFGLMLVSLALLAILSRAARDTHGADTRREAQPSDHREG